MKTQARKPACPRTAFVEAWGDPRLQRIFAYENLAKNLIRRGLPAAMEQNSRSRQHLPSPIPCPEHDIQSEKRIQSP